MPPDTLSAREVYQLLKDLALGVREIGRAETSSAGSTTVMVDGWQLTLFHEDGELDHCAACVAPDGRTSSAERWSRFGTDPLQLLSRWEREELQRLLRAL